MDYSKKRKCQRLWKILNLSQNERCKLEYKHIKAWKYRLDVSKLTMINIFQLQNVQRVPQYSKNCRTPNTAAGNQSWVMWFSTISLLERGTAGRSASIQPCVLQILLTRASTQHLHCNAKSWNRGK